MVIDFGNWDLGYTSSAESWYVYDVEATVVVK